VTDDEDDGVDRMAGSMRSMWREMPEQEPPMRGLDALMVAARTQAAVMAPEPEHEPWWRRAMAMLVRPPVLAAATAVLLVGSTVMLTRRSDDAVSSPTTQTFGEREGGAWPANAKTEGGIDRDGRDAAPGGNAGAAPERQPPTVARPLRPRPHRVAEPATPPLVTEQPAVTGQTEQHDKLSVATKKEDEKQPRPGDVKQGVEVKPADQVSEADAPAVAPTPTALPAAALVSVDQLIKQAEVAAGRKDCAAVRVTTERIRRLDGNVYKSRVATQPAIKRCL